MRLAETLSILAIRAYARGYPRAGRTLCRAVAWLTAALLVALAPACGTTPRQVAHVSIVTAGSVVAQVEDASEAAYVRATTALRERLAREHTSATYPTEVAPLDRAMDARTQAIAALSDALYAAAAINDLGDHVPAAQRQVAAARVVAALDRAVAVLADGRWMPPVDVPPALRAALAAMRQLAGPAWPDGGSDGG